LFKYEHLVPGSAEHVMLDSRVAQQSLAHQSLSRAVTEPEAALARALEEVFATGTHAFAAVAALLQAKGVARPSGATGAWTEAVLASELAALNASLDAAYATDGIGA
jgi:hypothetical protein